VPPSNTVAPAISGTPQQGDQLTVSDGTWTGDTPMTFSYAWSDGQSGKTITLGSGDVGQTITATVTATNDACPCTKNTATSAGVGPVTGATSPPPGGPIVSAYWEGWEPTAVNEANLPWADLTRVEMFSVEVENGTGLNTTPGGTPPAHYEVFSTSGVASGATSIPITGSVRGNGSFAFPSGAVVQSDYAGSWDCYNMAAYAKANGYAGSMDFDLQSEYGAYNHSFPCLDQIALGLGLTP
jgi:hypothetical protein